MPREETYAAGAAPSFTFGVTSDEFARVAPESIDRLASELHLIAERLRKAAEFRAALDCASIEQDEDPVDYLHP